MKKTVLEPASVTTETERKWKLYIDYRLINDVMEEDVHPIPNIEAYLDKFANAQYISKLDMTSAFLQMDEARSNITASTVQGCGRFRFK